MQLESSPHPMPLKKNMTRKRVLEAVLQTTIGKTRESSNNKNIYLWPSLRCHETSQETEKLKPSKCVKSWSCICPMLSSSFIYCICFNFHCISRFFHEWNHFLIAGGAPTAVACSHMICWCCWSISEMDITSPFHKTLNVNQPVTYFAKTTTCRWGGLVRKILAFCC